VRAGRRVWRRRSPPSSARAPGSAAREFRASYFHRKLAPDLPYELIVRAACCRAHCLSRAISKHLQRDSLRLTMFAAATTMAQVLVHRQKCVACLYDFPAEHWKHLRTTNAIESSFATVRHRTVRSKGCLSTKTALAMIFKLAEAAEKSWRRLDGHNQLPKIILGVCFTDGIEVAKEEAQTAA
jgi:hypothetical protein